MERTGDLQVTARQAAELLYSASRKVMATADDHELLKKTYEGLQISIQGMTFAPPSQVASDEEAA